MEMLELTEILTKIDKFDVGDFPTVNFLCRALQQCKKAIHIYLKSRRFFDVSHEEVDHKFKTLINMLIDDEEFMHREIPELKRQSRPIPQNHADQMTQRFSNTTHESAIVDDFDSGTESKRSVV